MEAETQTTIPTLAPASLGLGSVVSPRAPVSRTGPEAKPASAFLSQPLPERDRLFLEPVRAQPRAGLLIGPDTVNTYFSLMS